MPLPGRPALDRFLQVKRAEEEGKPRRFRWAGARARRFLYGATVLVVGAGVFHFWRAGAPKRESLRALAHLESCLTTAGQVGALDTAVRVPLGRIEQTVWEREEFLRKALRDEVSPEGIAVMKREGTFGPLREVFPAEAEKWGTLFGVRPEDCFAMRMERKGLRAEVVVLAKGGEYRVLRCNNVKQMADET
jgi:hypothetical protein